MTSKCIGALLVRDEAGEDRYLRRVLNNAAQFCDALVVLDDGSTDDTVVICRAYPAVVEVAQRVSGGWWEGGAEGSARAELWALAQRHAGEEGWVYVFDADHELVGIAPEDFRQLLRTEHVSAWACPLWDCWNSDETMRVDGYWQAHQHPRAWLARACLKSHAEALFSERGIHAGHLPAWPFVVGIMPEGAAIRHLSYVKEDHRLRKAKKYLDLAVIH